MEPLAHCGWASRRDGGDPGATPLQTKTPLPSPCPSVAPQLRSGGESIPLRQCRRPRRYRLASISRTSLAFWRPCHSFLLPSRGSSASLRVGRWGTHSPHAPLCDAAARFPFPFPRSPASGSRLPHGRRRAVRLELERGKEEEEEEGEEGGGRREEGSEQQLALGHVEQMNPARACRHLGSPSLRGGGGWWDEGL